jgi:hypothetical protein
MTPSLSHQKDPAAGWDIIASAKADKGEKITRVQIMVNDFSAYDKSFNPYLSSWQQQLTQKGVYPGDNTVQLVITNDKGDDCIAHDAWS